MKVSSSFLHNLTIYCRRSQQCTRTATAANKWNCNCQIFENVSVIIIEIIIRCEIGKGNILILCHSSFSSIASVTPSKILSDRRQWRHHRCRHIHAFCRADRLKHAIFQFICCRPVVNNTVHKLPCLSNGCCACNTGRERSGHELRRSHVILVWLKKERK